MFSARSLLLAVLSAPLIVLAQNANPFKIPSGGYSAQAGVPLTLNWTPTTNGTISLILRSGTSNNLNVGTYITSNYANSGTYTWTPDSSIPSGDNYAIEIVSDEDPSEVNYTSQFDLETPTASSSLTSQITLGVTSTASASSSASSPSSVSATTSSSASSSSHSSSSATSSASSTSASASSSASSTSMTTSASSSSASATSTTSSTSHGAAPRATVMAGMLGMVALGALAL